MVMPFNLIQPPEYLEEILNLIPDLLQLNKTQKKRLIERIETFTFKVRLPRKDERSCNKTPFFERWEISEKSYLTTDNPLYATREECNKIAISLLLFLIESYGFPVKEVDLHKVKRFLGRELIPNSLRCPHTNRKIYATDIKKALNYCTQRLGNYEIPLTYKKSLNDGGYHKFDNVTWMKPIHIIYELREDLKQKLREASLSLDAAKRALDKIQVKSYCTDKVTMPPFFSNRDVRWATWHLSHQYSPHYDCAMIELELMAQLYEFRGIPALDQDLAKQLEYIRQRPLKLNSRRCFITGKIMDFESYIEGAINSKGGQSKYHVGHITPLTRGGKHTWTNIAWASDDGNRIQGNDTIEEIEQKLIDAVCYHLSRDLEEGNIERIKIKIIPLLKIIHNIKEKVKI